MGVKCDGVVARGKKLTGKIIRQSLAKPILWRLFPRQSIFDRLGEESALDQPIVLLRGWS
jgi:hypothetical protein